MTKKRPKSRRVHLPLGYSGELAPSVHWNAFPPEREALVHFLLAIEGACPNCVRELAAVMGEPAPTLAEVESWRERWHLDAAYWESPKQASNFEYALDLVFECWRGKLADNETSRFLNDRWIGRHARARRIRSVLREVGPKALARGAWSPVLRLAVGTRAEVRWWRADWAGAPAGEFVFDPLDPDKNGIWSPPDPVRETRERGAKRLRRYFPHGKKTQADALWEEAEAALLASGAKAPEPAGTPLLDDFQILARYQVAGESLTQILAYNRYSTHLLATTQRVCHARDRAARAIGLRPRTKAAPKLHRHR